MTTSFFDCPLSELNIDRNELYTLMGYGQNIPGEDIQIIIDDLIRELSLDCTPRCGYTLKKGRILDKEHIEVGDVILNPGKIITYAMREADYYAFFTVTVGEVFDRLIVRLKKEDDMVKVFVADALGSVLADATVSWLMNRLSEEAASQNMLISNNYSPGYCDWLLIEQKKLFSLFPEGITGINLTDSCLMLPVKSISGIVAVGEHVKKRAYGCDICKMTNCVKNKKKNKRPS